MQKIKNINIRASEEDLMMLNALAENKQLPASTIIRQLVLEAYRKMIKIRKL